MVDSAGSTGPASKYKERPRAALFLCVVAESIDNSWRWRDSRKRKCLKNGGGSKRGMPQNRQVNDRKATSIGACVAKNVLLGSDITSFLNLAGDLPVVTPL